MAFATPVRGGRLQGARCSPPGDSPGLPAGQPVELTSALSVNALVQEQKRLEGRREQLRQQLAQVLDTSYGSTSGTTEGRVAQPGRGSGGAPAPHSMQLSAGQSKASAPRHIEDEPPGPAASTCNLEEQIRRMQEEWEKERAMWTAVSNFDDKEAARVSAQEAEKMLGAWRKAAAKGRHNTSQQQALPAEAQQRVWLQQNAPKMTHATTQTPDADEEPNVATCGQASTTSNIRAGPSALKLLTQQQAQQDQVRRVLKSKLAVALDPATAQGYHRTVEELNRQVYRLEARNKQMQEERGRERATWKQDQKQFELAQKKFEVAQNMFEQAQKTFAVALEKERSKAAAKTEALGQQLSKCLETVTLLETKSTEQAAELGARATSIQELTDQLSSARQELVILEEQNRKLEQQNAALKASHSIASAQLSEAKTRVAQLEGALEALSNKAAATLEEQNGKLEQQNAALKANHSIASAQLSEAKTRITQLEGALEALSNKAAADRTNITSRLSRITVQNACRHAVRTHETRKEVRALRSRYDAELAAVQMSWQSRGNTKLKQSVTVQTMTRQDAAFQSNWKDGAMWDKLLATALVDKVISAALIRTANETSTQRVLVAAAQKLRNRASAKCIRAWRDAVFEMRKQTEGTGPHMASQAKTETETVVETQSQVSRSSAAGLLQSDATSRGHDLAEDTKLSASVGAATVVLSQGLPELKHLIDGVPAQPVSSGGPRYLWQIKIQASLGGKRPWLVRIVPTTASAGGDRRDADRLAALLAGIEQCEQRLKNFEATHPKQQAETHREIHSRRQGDTWTADEPAAPGFFPADMQWLRFGGQAGCTGVTAGDTYTAAAAAAAASNPPKTHGQPPAARPIEVQEHEARSLAESVSTCALTEMETEGVAATRSETSRSFSANVPKSDAARLAALVAGIAECRDRLGVLEYAGAEPAR